MEAQYQVKWVISRILKFKHPKLYNVSLTNSTKSKWKTKRLSSKTSAPKSSFDLWFYVTEWESTEARRELFGNFFFPLFCFRPSGTGFSSPSLKRPGGHAFSQLRFMFRNALYILVYSIIQGIISSLHVSYTVYVYIYCVKLCETMRYKRG